jgi:hypothetical protein
MVGFCEHSNEPSGSIKKAGYFLKSWVTISFSNNVLHHGASVPAKPDVASYINRLSSPLRGPWSLRKIYTDSGVLLSSVTIEREREKKFDTYRKRGEREKSALQSGKSVPILNTEGRCNVTTSHLFSETIWFDSRLLSLFSPSYYRFVP